MSAAMRSRRRSLEIAQCLNDQERWLTHSRGIDMQTLQDVLGVQIDDLGARPELREAVWSSTTQRGPMHNYEVSATPSAQGALKKVRADLNRCKAGEPR